MALLLDEQVCLEKNIPNLPLFRLWPDHSQYLSRHFAKIYASFLLAFEKRTMLSLYITCVTTGPLTLALTPLMLLEQSSLSSILDSTSCPKMKRYDNRESPCLKPLLGLNYSDLPPLIRISNDTDKMQAEIHLIKPQSNSKLVSTDWIKLQLTLSYAFWRSNLMAMKPVSTFLTLKLWSSSWTIT